MPADAEWNQEAFITALLERQLADGGFGLILTDDSDVDLTSMTLTALAPYGDSDKTYTFTSAVTKEEVTTTVKEASEKAFACLAELESEDGTMLTYDTPHFGEHQLGDHGTVCLGTGSGDRSGSS